jgi:hypothetical protein
MSVQLDKARAAAASAATVSSEKAGLQSLVAEVGALRTEYVSLAALRSEAAARELALQAEKAAQARVRHHSSLHSNRRYALRTTRTIC